jgi:ATP-dependent DNA ligase
MIEPGKIDASRTVRYGKYSYLYPPRPENAVPASDIPIYEGMGFIAQPKLDGSSCLVFTNGEETTVMSRHASPFAKEPRLLLDGTFRALHRGRAGEWTVLVGELMNKSKTDERGRPFSDRYVVHDVLVVDGTHLVGTTFAERVALLDEMYGTEGSDQSELYSTGHRGVYRVKSHREAIPELFERLIGKAAMYEGIVMKGANTRLENGIRRTNTRGGQVKVRREGKNFVH